MEPVLCIPKLHGEAAASTIRGSLELFIVVPAVNGPHLKLRIYYWKLGLEDSEISVVVDRMFCNSCVGDVTLSQCVFLEQIFLQRKCHKGYFFEKEI